MLALFVVRICNAREPSHLEHHENPSQISPHPRASHSLNVQHPLFFSPPQATQSSGRHRRRLNITTRTPLPASSPCICVSPPHHRSSLSHPASQHPPASASAHPRPPVAGVPVQSSPPPPLRTVTRQTPRPTTSTTSPRAPSTGIRNGPTSPRPACVLWHRRGVSLSPSSSSPPRGRRARSRRLRILCRRDNSCSGIGGSGLPLLLRSRYSRLSFSRAKLLEVRRFSTY